MKSQSPAVTQASLVATAGRKAHKVHRKLQQAETELHTANQILTRKAQQPDGKKDMEIAVKQNVAAEEKVRDATQELQVVKELLAEADSDAHRGKSAQGSTGQSGDGVKSLIPHLERNRSSSPD